MKKAAKWFLVRLPFVLILSVLCLVGALKLVEGHPDALQKGLEEFFSGATQTRTTIGTVDEVAFFPSIDVQMNDITFHDMENAALIPLTIKTLDLKFPFSSVFVNSGKFEDILIEGFRSQEGFLYAHELYIEKMTTVSKEGPDQYGSFIVANGTYRQHPMTLEVKVEKTEKGYKIPRSIPFSLTNGDYALNAQYDNKRHAKLTDAVLSKGKLSSKAMTYELIQKKQYNKNNPLSCLIEAEDLAECDNYLNSTEE